MQMFHWLLNENTNIKTVASNRWSTVVFLLKTETPEFPLLTGQHSQESHQSMGPYLCCKCLAYFHANLHNTNKHKHTHTHKSGTVWTDRTKRRQYNNDQLSVSFLLVDNSIFFFTFSITNLFYKSSEWVQCLSATVSKRSERWLLLEH